MTGVGEMGGEMRWKKGCGKGTYLFRVEVGEGGARHVLGEADGLVPDLDGVEDDVFELVFGVAGAELPRVGVHCEGHVGLLLSVVVFWSEHGFGRGFVC